VTRPVVFECCLREESRLLKIEASMDPSVDITNIGGVSLGLAYYDRIEMLVDNVAFYIWRQILRYTALEDDDRERAFIGRFVDKISEYSVHELIHVLESSEHEAMSIVEGIVDSWVRNL